MTTAANDAAGPYVVWEDYGYEGWKPKSYATVRDALTDVRYNSFVLTRIVDFDVVEKETVNE